MLSSLNFGKSGQTLVVVHSAETPTDTDWAAWVDRMGQHDYRNILISSMGGGPSARQRRDTNKFWRGSGKQIPRFALVTTSRFVIGIVNAFNWFLDDQLRPFHPTALDDAFDYIEVPAAERADLADTIEVLRNQLGARAA